MSGKFRDWIHCRQTRNILPVLFPAVNHDVYKRCTAAFTWEHLTSSPRGVDNKEVLPPTRQSEAAYDIIRQRTLVSSMRHVLQICHFATFSYSHYWNEQWEAIAMLIFRIFRRPRQKNSAAFQKMLSSTASKTSSNAGKQCSDAGGSYFEEHSYHQSVSTSYSFLYRQSRNFLGVGCMYAVPILQSVRSICRRSELRWHTSSSVCVTLVVVHRAAVECTVFRCGSCAVLHRLVGRERLRKLIPNK